MKRPLLWTGFVFLSTIAAFFYLKPAAFLVAAALLCAIAVAGSGGKRKGRCAARFLFTSFAAVCAVLLSFAVYRARLAPFLAGEPRAEITVDTYRALGKLHLYEGRATLVQGEKRISVPVLLRSFYSLGVADGESFSCTVTVEAGESFRDLSPEGGIDLMLGEVTGYQDKPYHPLTAALSRFRGEVVERAMALAPGKEAGVLAALLTGDRRYILPEVTEAMRAAGMSHIIAVSGMHLSVFAMLLEAVLLAFGRSRRAVSAWVLLFSWSFAVFTGLSPSIIRAAVMLTMVESAGLLRRRSDPVTSLAFAGVLMALHRPAVLTSLSFQLSFLATAGIITLSSGIAGATGAFLERIFGGRRLKTTGTLLVSAFAVTASAQLFTYPMTILGLGNGFNPWALLSNSLAAFISQPLMAAGVMGIALSLLSGILAVPLGLVASFFLKALVSTAKIAAALPFAQIAFHERYQIVWLVAFYLVILLLLIWRPKRRTVILALLCAVFPILAASVFDCAVGFGRVELVSFDRSGAVAVVRGERAVLIGVPADKSGAYQIRDTFDRLGVRKLELVLAFDGDAACASPSGLLFEGRKPDWIMAPATPGLDAYCKLMQIRRADLSDTEGLVLGLVPIEIMDGSVRISFDGITVLKRADGCDIIGKTPARLLRLTAGADRYRLKPGGSR